jgi:hypothetical protein
MENKNLESTPQLEELKKEIIAAEEAHDEVYLNYLQRIYDNTITINIHAGGTLIMQSGNPTPPPKPPY